MRRYRGNTPTIEIGAIGHPQFGKRDDEKVVESSHTPNHHNEQPLDLGAGDGVQETLTLDAQDGVKKIEATTTVWTRNHLIAAYILMWFINFVDSLQQGASGNLTPYVTSAFKEHHMTAYVNVISGIVGGVLKLPLAKVLDIFGRPHGFALMVVMMVAGLAMMAACDGIQTYAAAQLFYWTGYNGISYTMSVFVADTSSLKNRGLMFAYISSPYLLTLWMTGYIANWSLHGPGWRWFFGGAAVVTLIVTIPLFALFTWNYRKAVKAGVIEPTKSNRTFVESIKYYAIEFDVGGLFLITTGLVLFLLPFNLYQLQKYEWRAPMIISMIIFGGVLLIAFAFYEKHMAPKTFLPYQLLLDRTVLGACALSALLFVSWYIWHSYFGSFLQVVNGLSITQSNFVLNIYSFGSCLFSLIVGVLIRWTGRFKWLAVYVGVPMMILGVGLLIHFRQPDVHLGYIIMAQIFIAIAGGVCVITEQVAVMAVADHRYIAVILAVEGMFSSIGGGIGGSIASAIWTGVFPKKLAQHLPQVSDQDLLAIYDQLPVQLSYPRGTPIRHGIELAYGDAQRWMNVAAAAIFLLAIPATLLWRDIRVKDFKQTKGRVI